MESSDVDQLQEGKECLLFFFFLQIIMTIHMHIYTCNPYNLNMSYIIIV